jgi:hypothetical protein
MRDTFRDDDFERDMVNELMKNKLRSRYRGRSPFPDLDYSSLRYPQVDDPYQKTTPPIKGYAVVDESFDGAKTGDVVEFKVMVGNTEDQPQQPPPPFEPVEPPEQEEGSEESSEEDQDNQNQPFSEEPRIESAEVTEDSDGNPIINVRGTID